MNPCAPHPPCPECWSHRRHWRSPGSCAVVSVCRPDSWYTCCPALPQKPALPDSLAVWLSDGFRGPEGPAEQQGAEWQGWTTSSPLPPCFDARVWEGWDASLTTAAMCRGGQRVLPWAGALLEFHWLSSPSWLPQAWVRKGFAQLSFSSVSAPLHGALDGGCHGAHPAHNS